MSNNLKTKVPFIPGTNPKEISFSQKDLNAIDQNLIALSDNNTISQIPLNQINE